MKKKTFRYLAFLFIIIIGIVLFFHYRQQYQNKEEVVTLNQCVDGDTAWFNIQAERVKVRFLAIDTPELNGEDNSPEPWAIQASDTTCSLLTNASKIVLEYDSNSTALDKYGRTLAWVWVDDELVQLNLVDLGYAKVAYLYGDYRYTNRLEVAQIIAKMNKLGLWQGE